MSSPSTRSDKGCSGWRGTVPLATPLLALTILLGSTGVAVATQCQEVKGGGARWWSWRIVEGRKCWFRGRHKVPKSRLYWDAPRRVRKDPVPETLDLDLPPHAPTITIIPVAPAPASFSDRWRGDKP